MGFRWNIARTASLRLAVLATAAALAAVACGSHSGPESLTVFEDSDDRFEAVNAAGHSVVVDWTVPEIRLPLDQFVLMPNPHASDLVSVAADRLIEQCMADKGIDYDVPDRQIRGVESLHLRRYGPIEESVVRSYGYELPPSPEDIQAIEEFQRTTQPPEVDEALVGQISENDAGPPVGDGCVFTWSSELADPDPDAGERFFQAQGLAVSSLESALLDPATQAALQRWRDCIADRGIAAGTSAHPLVIEGGIDTAVADLECKRESDLVETWAAVEAVLQADIYADNAALFETAKAEQVDYITAAAASLGVELSEEFREFAGLE